MQLIAALTAEHAALLKFAALLEREQTLLVENLVDQLLKLSEQKSSDALTLARLAETRHNLLQENIPQSIASAMSAPDTIHAWLTIHSPEGLVIWEQIRNLANRVQNLNRTNGELIMMKLRHNQQALAALSNAAAKANLYGPDGQHDFTAGSGRSLGSG